MMASFVVACFVFILAAASEKGEEGCLGMLLLLLFLSLAISCFSYPSGTDPSFMLINIAFHVFLIWAVGAYIDRKDKRK